MHWSSSGDYILIEESRTLSGAYHPFSVILFLWNDYRVCPWKLYLQFTTFYNCFVNTFTNLFHWCCFFSRNSTNWNWRLKPIFMISIKKGNLKMQKCSSSQYKKRKSTYCFRSWHHWIQEYSYRCIHWPGLRMHHRYDKGH